MLYVFQVRGLRQVWWQPRRLEVRVYQGHHPSGVRHLRHVAVAVGSRMSAPSFQRPPLHGREAIIAWLLTLATCAR